MSSWVLYDDKVVRAEPVDKSLSRSSVDR
jgi:hypothetical protein